MRPTGTRAARATPDDAGPNDAMPDTEPRFPWGHATQLALVALLCAAGVLFLPHLSGTNWLGPLLIYLGLRGAMLTSHLLWYRHPPGRFLTAVTGAAGWAWTPLGAYWAITGIPPLEPPLWVAGAALILAGLTLLCHHERCNAERPGTGTPAGLLGLALTPPGVVLATTGVIHGGVGLALALTAGVGTLILLWFMRPREGATDRPAHGFSLLAHRFRLLFIALPVAAYLVARPHLQGVWLLFPLWAWEFVAAVAFVAFLLWAGRRKISKALSDTPLQSPHRRHEPSVTRHSEEGFDEWEEALRRFLHEGEPAEVERLAARLEQADKVAARAAFAPVTGLRRRSWILLVHPGWLYMAAFASVAVLALFFHHYKDALGHTFPGLPPDILHALTATIVGTGVFLTQFNRHGGPWWIKSLVAYAGVLVLLVASWPAFAAHVPWLRGGGAVLIGAILVAQPLVHALGAARPTPPAYAYHGHDPIQATNALAGNVRRTLLVRSGLVVVMATALLAVAIPLSRLEPAFLLLIPVTAAMAAFTLVTPLVTLLGLRTGHRRIRRIAKREAEVRKRHLETALLQLDDAYRTREDRLVRDRRGAWRPSS